MKLLRRIRDTFTPRKHTGNPWSLKDSEVRALRALYTNPSYETYQNLLDKVAMLYMDALLSTDDPAKAERLRGFVNGLRRAGTLIDEIIHKETIRDASERRTREPRDNRDRLYATRAWTGDGDAGVSLRGRS